MACGDACSCFWVYEGFGTISDKVRTTVELNLKLELLKVVNESKIITVAAAKR